MIKTNWATLPNWGDTINPILIEKISGIKPTLVKNNPDYLCVGSILSWATKNTIVWGSGFIAKDRKIKYDIDIRAVRGPLTRNMVLEQGYNCPEIYGDPALLYPRFYKPNIQKKYRFGIIPHYVDQNSKWLNQFLNNANVKIIDIKVPSDERFINKFVDEVNECEIILSSSLHGIIAADAYGIPSYWIELSNNVIGNGFKFRDYFSSVGRPNIEPFRPNYTDKIKDFSSDFYKYDINIDLDLLYEACPFKNNT